jgi:small subunit ribosomal protein S17e
MGRIRTKDIKDLARDLHEVYPDRFTPDFEENKKVMADLKIVEGKSKRFRNKVAGYIVRLVRQVAHGHHPTGERGPETEAEEMEQAAEQKAVEEIAAEEAEETEVQPQVEETKPVEEKTE